MKILILILFILTAFAVAASAEQVRSTKEITVELLLRVRSEARLGNKAEIALSQTPFFEQRSRFEHIVEICAHAGGSTSLLMMASHLADSGATSKQYLDSINELYAISNGISGAFCTQRAEAPAGDYEIAQKDYSAVHIRFLEIESQTSRLINELAPVAAQ